MKKIVSMILVLCLVASLLTALPIMVNASYSGTCGENLTWTLDNTGTLTISGTGEMYDWMSTTAPWYHRSIRSSITKVVIEDGVANIGDSAFFGCDSLTNIILPNSITNIGDSAFLGCDSLASITIPDSVTSIGEYAFCCCDSLFSITIPDSVTSIGEYAFSESTGLVSIKVDIENPSYDSIDGILFDKCEASIIRYPPGKNVSSYTIPDSVATIGVGAFSDCDNLTSITIPNSVTSIGQDAFYGCYSLTNITLPNSVTSIGEGAFGSCHSLTNITIPNSVTHIGEYTFSHCDSLTNIAIPNSVTSIGEGAFSYCDSLTNITIPDGVTSIGDFAFSCCDSLTNITIPNSVTSIGEYTFSCCDSLTDVYYTGSEADWRKISIGTGNSCLTNATIHYNHVIYAIEQGQYAPTTTEIPNDGKVVEVSADDLTGNNYAKYTTIRPKVTDNAANLVGNWHVKNTMVETGDINSGVRITLSGDLIIENGVFHVTNGTSMSVANLKIGTNGKMIVDGTLHVAGKVLLYGGSSKNAGGYLEINRNNAAFNTAVVTCNAINISDYATIKVNGRMDVNGNMYVATKNTNSSYTDTGSIWLRGNFTQEKGGLFAAGNNFCPSDKFKFILNQNVSSAVHKLNFQSKKSYINDLYIVKGTYDNFYDGNATIFGVKKKIVPATNENGYVFEETTAKFQKEKNEWRIAYNELFNTISTNKESYVDLATNQSYFINEFGEETYHALRAYFGVLCLCMNVEPASSFAFLSPKNDIPHEVSFINSDTKRSEKKTFYINAMGSEQDAARIRYVTYKDKETGDTKRFCVLMLANIEPVGKNLQDLVASNYAEFYASLIGLSVNAFNKEPQKNIAKLLWEGVACSKFNGIGSSVEGAIGDFIKSESFVNFVSKQCNFNPNKASILSLSNYDDDVTKADLTSENKRIVDSANDLAQLMTTTDGLFADKNFENAIRAELSLAEETEITADMLSKITALNLPEKYISNIKGIEHMTALETLDLSGNAISDISYISGLTKLTDINLNGNNISNISALENLTGLARLKLNSNHVSDLSPLEKLASLMVLDLGNNAIEDMTPLAGLEKVFQLNIAHNRISSLDALEAMVELEVLFAQNNNISNISGVKKLNLKTLNLANNNITEISALVDLPLTQLNLSNNGISDISSLMNKVSITSLDLSGTEVEQAALEILTSLSALKELSVQDTGITDISGISDLSVLESLSVANTGIIDFAELGKMTTLKKLDISDVNISDFSFIAKLTRLEELYADNCMLADNCVEDISGLTNLKKLSFASNYISQVDFISGLSNLEYLDLSNNIDIPSETIDRTRTDFESKNKTLKYTLANISVTDIFMDREEVILELGNPVRAFAQIYPYNATDEDIVYSSSDNTVVTYRENMLVPVGTGVATVKVQNADGDIMASCKVSVVSNAEIVHLEVVRGGAGFAATLSARGVPATAGVYLGAYDGAGTLISLEALTLIEGTAQATLPLEAVSAKAFIWDMGKMIPLTEAKELRL